MPDTDTDRAERKRRTVTAFMVILSQCHQPGGPLQSARLTQGIASRRQGTPTQTAARR
ncbi:hypothetical protein [Aquitalea magnusonii]|uniref:hypothetical protein n=1 Tax=Aquitalea magnusonii TaxID=332411 RepID=UPI00131458EA|nr:hypothetical protein [Aquitalea magnusonii]